MLLVRRDVRCVMREELRPPSPEALDQLELEKQRAAEEIVKSAIQTRGTFFPGDF